MKFLDATLFIPRLLPAATAGFFIPVVPRVAVSTPRGKTALAKSLLSHDPDFLDDLKLIAAKLGPFAAVHYASTQPEITAAVAADVAEAKRRYIDEISS